MITLRDIARAAGYMTIPPEGAWVCVVGCPLWQKGKRLIAAHRKIGIQHFDIYWAAKEEPICDLRVNRFRRRRRPLVEQMYYDVAEDASEDAAKRAFERVVGEYKDYMRNGPSGHSRLQASYVTIAHSSPEEVRFFNGEVRVFGAETIRMLLAEGQVETIFFGQAFIPILEGALSEMVDALQMDGLSEAEAYHMALTSGIIQPDDTAGWVPTWFYRPCGWIRNQFCEEIN